MLLAALFLGLFGHSDPVPHDIIINGHLEQGGLVEIRVFNAKVELDGQELDTISGGRYLIGFGRDAKPQSKLVVKFTDGYKEKRKLDIIQKSYNISYINGVSNNINTPSKDTLNTIHKEVFELATARYMGDYSCPDKFDFAVPAPGAVRGVFGSNRVYNGVPGKPHSGVDFAGAMGDPAYAPENGKIVFYQNMVLTGNTLVIDHGCGVVSTLMHLSGSDKQVGDDVKKGDIVGRIGMTGIATGPHLHWSLNYKSTRLDPLLVLK